MGIHQLNFQVKDESSKQKTKILGQFTIPLTLNYDNGQEMMFNRELQPKDLTKAKKPRGRLKVKLKKINENSLNMNGRHISSESNYSARNSDTNNQNHQEQQQISQPENQPSINSDNNTSLRPTLPKVTRNNSKNRNGDTNLPEGWDIATHPD